MESYGLNSISQMNLSTTRHIFEFLSALRAYHVTIMEGVVDKKFFIFEDFQIYLGEFLILLREICFNSKILLSFCKDINNLIISALVTTKQGLKSKFCLFLTIF